MIASRAIASVFGFPLEHLGNPIILIVTAEISIRFAGPHRVIPAEAGIQSWRLGRRFPTVHPLNFWIPACAGMTNKGSRGVYPRDFHPVVRTSF